jgi:hypothetical protein
MEWIRWEGAVEALRGTGLTMPVLLVIHAAATWALMGLIWTIQWVHYPLFDWVGSEEFRAYHRQHTTRITWVVGPLMFVELVTAVGLLMCGEKSGWLLASVVPLGFNWLCTWRVQVPLHEQLSHGLDASLVRRLVRSNRWRTAAWTLRGICVGILIC